ncbi:hypothetical protein Tco_0351174 [Tanacetum coccineum]
MGGRTYFLSFSLIEFVSKDRLNSWNEWNIDQHDKYVDGFEENLTTLSVKFASNTVDLEKHIESNIGDANAYVLWTITLDSKSIAGIIDCSYKGFMLDRHVKRGHDTKIPQSSGPPVKVGDEVVHKELGDRIEKIQEDAGIQGRTSADTEIVLDQEEPTELVGDLGSGEKGEKEISTANILVSTASCEL